MCDTIEKVFFTTHKLEYAPNITCKWFWWYHAGPCKTFLAERWRLLKTFTLYRRWTWLHTGESTLPASSFNRSLRHQMVFYKHKIKPVILKSAQQYNSSNSLQACIKNKKVLEDLASSCFVQVRTWQAELVFRLKGYMWKSALVSVVSLVMVVSSVCLWHTSRCNILEHFINSCINVCTIPEISTLMFAACSSCPCVPFWSY